MAPHRIEEESAEEVTALAKPADIMPIDRIPMDERRRWLIKIVMLIRYTFRGYFGLKFANKWGFYVDRHMSRKIHEFQDWIEYPNWDHVLHGHTDEVRSAVISRDGCFLYTGSHQGMMIACDLIEGHIIREWKAHDHSIYALTFRSGLLVSGSYDNSIKIWDTWRDCQLVHTLEGHTNFVTSVEINDKSTELVSGSLDNSIRIWSVKTGECIRVLTGHSESVTSLQIIGNLILSASHDESLKVWNSSDGSEIQNSNEGIVGFIYDVNINCDASLVACTTQFALCLFTWPELKYIRKIDACPFRCSFHPTHPTILTVNNRDTHVIQIFDLTKDEIIRSFEGHFQFIHDLCFTPDGFLLISVSYDKSVRIWDVSDV